jgi:uncharacterized protein YjgD (DUF1641 family)
MTETTTMEQAPAVTRTDVLDQLMKPEVQQSLTVLVENLPKLTEMVTFLTNAYDLVKNVATDEVLIEDLKAGMDEFVTPLKDKAKGLAATAMEANERAAADTTTVGLFGVLKMLKDPQIQKTLRFTQAFLDVLNEKEKQSK